MKIDKILRLLKPRYLLLSLGTVAVVLTISHLSLQYVNLSLGEKQGQIFELSNRLDMDDEHSLPTWFSQALLSMIAVASLGAALLESNRKVRNTWLALSALGLLASVNEIAGLHELVVQSLHLLFFGTSQATLIKNGWIILLIPVLAIGIWAFFRVASILPKRTLLLFVSGAVIYFAGAVIAEIFGTGLNKATFMYQGVSVAIEEGLEFFGSITVLYGIVDYIHDHQRKKITMIKSIILSSKTDA